MNEPIDIKTKKIISQSVKEGFDKSLVHDALQRNIIMHWIFGVNFSLCGRIELI